MDTTKGIVTTALSGKVPRVSFEFFPPKTKEMEKILWTSINRLMPLKSNFVSVTYGAGGSTRSRTHKTVVKILRETNLTPAAHLTCVGASRNEVDEVALSYWNSGISKIVALRGDPPSKEIKFTPHPDGYNNAAHLVEGLKKVADFDISVASSNESIVVLNLNLPASPQYLPSL